LLKEGVMKFKDYDFFITEDGIEFDDELCIKDMQLSVGETFVVTRDPDGRVILRRYEKVANKHAYGPS